MNLVEEARSVLDNGGYRTTLGTTSPNTFYFEDDLILGAVFIHSTVSALISGWEGCQDGFLGNNSRALRSAPIKAWNIYTVHLTADRGSPSQVTEAFGIEQDFRGTRKLVRLGLTKRSDVRDALLPLLPLQHRTAVSTTNVTARLVERLSLSSQVIARIVGISDPTTLEQELLEEP